MGWGAVCNFRVKANLGTTGKEFSLSEAFVFDSSSTSDAHSQIIKPLFELPLS